MTAPLIQPQIKNILKVKRSSSTPTKKRKVEIEEKTTCKEKIDFQKEVEEKTTCKEEIDFQIEVEEKILYDEKEISSIEAISYEEARKENIRKNTEILKSLNLFETKDLLKLNEMATTLPEEKPKARQTKERKSSQVLRRQSSRLKPQEQEEITDSFISPCEIELIEPFLKPAEVYFDQIAIEKAIHVDGHFRGWLNPEVVRKYELENNAKDAWEKNGGGKFSFKSDAKPAGAPKGWSSAKSISAQLFRKNPNAYFYRHNEPGMDQNTGDWSEEEKELFLDVARQFGCGDKWGLFASFIPHRVGYQCSNYYRQVIIPKGYVIDPNYRINQNGTAIYVGQFNKSKRCRGDN